MEWRRFVTYLWNDPRSSWEFGTPARFSIIMIILYRSNMLTFRQPLLPSSGRFPFAAGCHHSERGEHKLVPTKAAAVAETSTLI